jgi:hypothetical protein
MRNRSLHCLTRRSPRKALGAILTLGIALLPIGVANASGLPSTEAPAIGTAAVLISPHRAHRAPSGGSVQLMALPARTPITGEATTLPILAHRIGRFGIRWLKVMLPGRPNGSSGWIAAQGTRQLILHWHLVVDLARRTVSAYRDGRLVRELRAVVGKPSTPTPTGEFFVEESERMPVGHPGGPYALALSARSDVLREFEGGPGQIALHERDSLGGVLGSAESHGCVRLATAGLDWLVARIVPGTPTTIQAGS